MTKRELNKIGYDIIAAAIEVHKEIGPGLLESVYQICLVQELKSRGYLVEQEVQVPILYKGVDVNTILRADIVLNKMFIIEVKATKEYNAIFEGQTLTYMKFLKCPKGIIINFFTNKITDSSVHLVNDIFRNLKD